MEATETLTSPAAESDEASEIEAAESEPSLSGESASLSDADDGLSINAQMNALIRGQLGQRVDSASKPDGDGSRDSSDSEPDGESAPTGDVKPSDAPAPRAGRRGAAAEIERLNAEVARLSTALEAITPKVPDASEEARARAIETESRYRRLLVKPEADADWTAEDIQFLESEKQRRAVAPELEQHYSTVVEQTRRTLSEQAEAERAHFWDSVRADLATAADVPGVDFEAVKAARTFAERDRLMYRAGAASLESELKALRSENADLRRDLFGATRTPLSSGRSSPGRTYDANSFMNDLIRRGGSTARP